MLATLPRPLARTAGALLIAVAAGATAWAQPLPPAATRMVQGLQQLEMLLLQAMQGRDKAAIERLLDDDFEMRVAQEPGTPVIREDWVDSVVRSPRGEWVVRQLAVHDLGDVRVGSFELAPAAAGTGKPSIFVVDTWRRDGSGWRLLVRHAAPVAGSRRAIPGDAASKTIRKQI